MKRNMREVKYISETSIVLLQKKLITYVVKKIVVDDAKTIGVPKLRTLFLYD
jgi:hypothetical protein